MNESKKTSVKNNPFLGVFINNKGILCVLVLLCVIVTFSY